MVLKILALVFPMFGNLVLGDKINLPLAKNGCIHCVKGLSLLCSTDYEYCNTGTWWSRL